MSCGKSHPRRGCDCRLVADRDSIGTFGNALTCPSISSDLTRTSHTYNRPRKRPAWCTQACGICRAERCSLSDLGEHATFECGGCQMELYVRNQDHTPTP